VITVSCYLKVRIDSGACRIAFPLLAAWERTGVVVSRGKASMKWAGRATDDGIRVTEASIRRLVWGLECGLAGYTLPYLSGILFRIRQIVILSTSPE
jgi:hypothetical protein